MASANKGAGFYDDLLKNNSPDADFVGHVKEIQRTIKAAGDPPSAGTLQVRAIGGTLNFALDSIVGQGDGVDKKGVGFFNGNELKDHAQGGTYKLWMHPLNAKLELYNADGNLVDTYIGKGSEFDLDTTPTTPWEGDWQ
ncbi:hypothetical protein EWM64_g7781 [Hericium alpestre]|uniref:Uncharacterized protein n=1 Tax=Hericium alpestre TaxID=135208 RepID=A0A4Y9ZN68_9AGAM|nr:hypothetical protein EWM64_g7781 [Hericium alpestre]